MTAMKKYLRLARTDILYMLVWQVGFYLFGMAMVLIINRFVNDDQIGRASCRERV